MSRREEVEAMIISADGEYCDGAWIGPESLRYLCRTLADEIDAERAVVTKLLAMLKPGEEPKPPRSDASMADHHIWESKHINWLTKANCYRRACEIAGRTE